MMYSNLNAPPTLGANFPPNVAPMPTYTSPAYSYGCPSYRDDFTLIVVLFILLIIVGASYYSHGKC